MAKKLEKIGKNIAGHVVPDVIRHVLDTQRLVRQDREEVNKPDAISVLACGSGLQAVADALTDTPVIAGLDTNFSANKFRAGQFEEWCSACGEYVVDEYLGICPVTRCPKGQLNGPCGGSQEGKFEVDTDRDCVWALIYERMEQQRDREGITTEISCPKDFEKSSSPREQSFEPRRG